MKISKTKLQGKKQWSTFSWSWYSISENLHEPHYDLPFLLEINKVNKVKIVAANLRDNRKYDILIRNLRQALNHWLLYTKKPG